MKNKVNLLIIGTQKAGTTSLYEYLKQHTDIYFPDIKEIAYFVDDASYKKGDAYYHSFFTKVGNEKIIASAYVHMLSSHKAPERVKKYNAAMKFIVMLREPASRAYSAYNYALKKGWEDEKNSFEKTILLEQERMRKEQYNLMYFENGKYHKHLSYWMKYFPRENFLIIKDTELKNDRQKVLKKVFEFLQIDPNEPINTSKEFNKAGIVRSKSLHAFLLNKNSLIKKFLSALLPRKSQVWIRANIIAKLIKFNEIDKEYDALDENIALTLEQVYKDDLNCLERDFYINFKNPANKS